MSFPLDLLAAWLGWLDRQVLVRAVQNRVILGAPYDTIDWLTRVHKLRSKLCTSGPDLDLTILTSGGKGSTLITPFDSNNCRCMGLSLRLLNPAFFVHNSEGAIGAPEGKYLL